MIFFVFANGDVDSIKIIQSAFVHFQGVSGLRPNFHKSLIFFNEIDGSIRKEIYSILQFNEVLKNPFDLM